MSNDNTFIIDAVAHPYNFREDNHGDSSFAQVAASSTSELAWALVAAAHEPAYSLPRGAYLSDWTVEDTAAMLFKESLTDVSVCHHLPIYAYKDGLVSMEKTAEAVEKYPTRFIGAYAGIDPLHGKEALRALERQLDMYGGKTIGVKMYPTSWANDTVRNWRMDDAEVTFPILEKAAENGIKVTAVHKSIPIGPVPGDEYAPGDVAGAATHFPDMNFEVVHAGLSHVEETAWLMARYPNIYINLEIWNIVLLRRPRLFAKMMLDLLSVGGEYVLDRLVWGTGTILHHPRPTIEAFLDFEFPEDLLEQAGFLGPIPQITMEHKKKILADNYARMHGLDVEQLQRNIGTDQFTRDTGELPAPYSTTSKWDEIRQHQQAGEMAATTPPGV
jgi:predicted TIM-barrel fold metal-dependent hydrolase